MSPVEAVKTCLSKYVVFSGRARRSEYWWFFLFNIIIGAIGNILDSVLHLSYLANSNSAVNYTAGPIASVLGLALLLPGIAAGVRRLHDTGRSGWWILISLIPCIGGIWLLVLLAQDSQPDNQYGPNPKNSGPGATPSYGDTMR